MWILIFRPVTFFFLISNPKQTFLFIILSFFFGIGLILRCHFFLFLLKSDKKNSSIWSVLGRWRWRWKCTKKKTIKSSQKKSFITFYFKFFFSLLFRSLSFISSYHSQTRSFFLTCICHGNGCKIALLEVKMFKGEKKLDRISLRSRN